MFIDFASQIRPLESSYEDLNSAKACPRML